MFTDCKISMLFLGYIFIFNGDVNAMNVSRAMFDHLQPSWLHRLRSSTTEELQDWFADLGQEVNVRSYDGIPLLNRVLNNETLPFEVKETLLNRPDLHTDIKMDNRTVLAQNVYALLQELIHIDDYHLCLQNIRLLRSARVPAKLENMDDETKAKLMQYGKGLSLEQSFNKLIIGQTLFYCLVKKPEKTDLVKCCLVRCDNNYNEHREGYNFWGCGTFDNAKIVLMAHFIWQPWVVSKVTGTDCLIQERYSELEELFPDDQKENRMRFLRYIVLSNLPNNLIDADIDALKAASMARRQAAQEASTESNSVPVKLDQESQELVDYMSQRWLLDKYQQIHDADINKASSDGRVTELDVE